MKKCFSCGTCTAGCPVREVTDRYNPRRIITMALRFPNERIFTSLERRMKCGIGKCGRCNIGHLYVCKNGPVFSYAQLEKLPRDY